MKKPKRIHFEWTKHRAYCGIGFELNPLATVGDWNEVTCGRCQRKYRQRLFVDGFPKTVLHPETENTFNKEKHETEDR